MRAALDRVLEKKRVLGKAPEAFKSLGICRGLQVWNMRQTHSPNAQHVEALGLKA